MVLKRNILYVSIKENKDKSKVIKDHIVINTCKPLEEIRTDLSEGQILFNSRHRLPLVVIVAKQQYKN